jgi:hypothetical protein
MRIAAAVLSAFVLLVGAAPVAAKKAKPPNPCRVLLPADLETIFEQPWQRGVRQVGGPCRFERPTAVPVPNIVVSLIVERKASRKKAKQAFARAEEATSAIVEQMEPVPGLGQRGHLTTILGADVLSFRVRRDVVEVRVDRVDRPEESYRDQILAIGAVVEARLLPPPAPTTRAREKPRRSSG